MREIVIHRPEISGGKVTFSWTVDPPTSLYGKERFTLSFPPAVDLGRVAEGLWWRIALITLHSHWVLLRPCRVRLPVALLGGEAEMWLRLMDAEIATLESYSLRDDPSRRASFERQIEIVEEGPMLAPSIIVPCERAATAFSGGKDSLLQTGLLTELTERPLLVTVTSPRPGQEDHVTPRRREVLAEIRRRRAIDLVEVESDYRANLSEKFAQERGYPIALNEMTDTLLYLGALVAAAAALGAGRLFLASEAEVQENVEIDGRLVQHKHFMYSLVTLSAIDAALRPWGIGCSSLTSPLHSYQVQQLLWTRYSDLRDLQYSCWRVKSGQSVCQACPQCLRIAFSALSIGAQPQEMGLDMAATLVAMKDWRARRPSGNGRPAFPDEIVSIHLHEQVLRSILSTRPRTLLSAIGGGRPARLLRRQFWQALGAYLDLRKHAMSARPGPAPGYRPGFLSFIDPALRERVGQIYAEHFAPEDEKVYAQSLARIRRETRRIAETLAGAAEPASGDQERYQQ